jgi:hypothetical protein
MAAAIAIPVGLLFAAAAAMVGAANSLTPQGRKANEQTAKALGRGLKNVADAASEAFGQAKVAAVAACAAVANAVDVLMAESNQAETESGTASDGGVFGPGTLTPEEAKEIQDIADKHNTPIDVVGSRAEGRGRNIDKPSLPVGKGEGTRSDIDIRIDGQADIDSRGELSNDVSNASSGAGNSIGDIGISKGPAIQFRPGQPPKVVK